mmetsp:Transcript_19435/g.29874  ORF Transcript_19435/g.29874 Transcript_19435/m.29874 type:complete len:257 (-) Transcript_19435:248-1018(-)|eukprot:CAMPEP_0170492112 /NCGR_PEP_ID=MMETSP0208-20121228/11702_1 /TAXON_ID=197538 /ORGANISM="Strombidium inclinatum, Strain S3" /LENGTH=256 /DNA_ID=CAMNT_0010767807 /DNA_START=276 /DNA_END=1046 /DNA_ORIENTATION=+
MDSNSFTVKLLDVKATTEADGTCYFFLVMEYLPLSLFDILNKAEELEICEGAIHQILEKLLRAIHFLHSAGIMHRDIKPQNILVDAHLNVKLCDFGLSKSLPNKDGGRYSSRPERRNSAHVQTRYYRSPEVILLERDYDERIDLWSLGCVLGEMLLSLPCYRREVMALRILFPGQSCYPLSPISGTDEAKIKVTINDQLRCILRVLGKLSDEDKAFVTTNSPYLSKLCVNELSKIRFADEFPHTEGSIIRSLEGLL